METNEPKSGHHHHARHAPCHTVSKSKYTSQLANPILFGFNFFYCDYIHVTELTIELFLGVQLGEISYIHNVVQPSLLSTSKTFFIISNRNSVTINTNPHSLCSQAPEASSPLSVSMNFI